MKKYLYIAAGFTFLALGIVGIFLPVLPTTPFILLSAACFLRGSQRLYVWLTGHRLFGKYIRNYLKYHAISIRSKVISLLTLWVVILMTVIFAVKTLWLRILLILIAAAVSVHLLRMRTLTPRMLADDEEKESTEKQ